MKLYLILTLVSIVQFGNALVINGNSEAISQKLSESESSSKTSELGMVSSEISTEETTTKRSDSELLTHFDKDDMNTAESSIVFRPLFAYRRKMEKKRRNDKPSPTTQTINNRQQKVYYVAYPYYYYPDYSNYYPANNYYYPSSSSYNYPYYYDSPYQSEY